MTISNFFLFMNSILVSFITFLASSLLVFQAFFAIMVTRNDRFSFAPRVLQPTEFMVGLCLGLCVGGAILAFFVSVSFRRFFSICKNADQDNCESLGITGPLWSVWWWSSIICCSNMLLSYYILIGRDEISQTQQQGYNSIDSQSPSDISSLTDTKYGGEPPPSFQQDPNLQARQQLQALGPQQNQHGYSYPEKTAGGKIMSV